MFHDTALNCENFQDLRLWCSTSLPQHAAATEPIKPIATEDIAGFVTAPLFPAVSGQDYGLPSPLEPIELFATTPHQPLSPDTAFSYQSLDKGLSLEDELFDISNLPIVFGREDRWDPAADQPRHSDWSNILDNEILKSYGTQATSDSGKDYSFPTHLDLIPDAPPVTDEVVISEFVLNRVDSKVKIESDILLPYNSNQPYGAMEKSKLRLDTKRIPLMKTSDLDIGTPDVLNYVEQLEAERFGPMDLYLPKSVVEAQTSSVSEMTLEPTSDSAAALERLKEEPADSEEDTYRHSPAPRRAKRRRASSDSDSTYTPSVDSSPPRRARKRSALPTPPSEPKRRGRPPKRRPSGASSVAEDNASCVSVEDMRYRELRDKNNEASKRSRMNRKQKEQHMEEMATRLEERNKRLQVKADILEDMTKRLKDALMTAILNK